MEMNKYINYDRLGKFLTISNTASFLYNRFINDEGVLSLFCDFDTKTLIEKFVEIYQSDDIKSSRLVELYVLIVVISLKSDEYSEAFFKTLSRLDDIKWNNEIVSIYNNRQKVTFLENSVIQNYEYSNFIPSNSIDVKEYSL